jgi:hypothetical protein
VTQVGDTMVVQLLDPAGALIGRCVVPCHPSAPPVLVCGNRYFRALYVRAQYIETTCYLVPLENMYAPSAPIPGAPKGKKSR